MPNQEMPDSDYDIDQIGYGSIWFKAKAFHADLLDKSQTNASKNGRRVVLYDDVQLALGEINDEIHQKIQKQSETQKQDASKSLRKKIVGYFDVVGSGLIGAWLGKVVEILATNQNLDNIPAIFWLASFLGVMLISIGLNYRE